MEVVWPIALYATHQRDRASETSSESTHFIMSFTLFQAAITPLIPESPDELFSYYDHQALWDMPPGSTPTASLSSVFCYPGLLPVPLGTRHSSSLRSFAHVVSGMLFSFPQLPPCLTNPHPH